MRIRTERGAATRRRGWPERAARPRQAPAGGPGPRTLGRRGRGAVEPLRKAAPRSLKRLQKHLPRHPASLLVGLYPRNTKSKNARPYKGLDASVFTVARNQTRPSVSVDTRMDRQTAARPHGGLRPSGYKGWTTDACENPDGPRNDVPRGRRHDTQMGPFPGNQKTQPSPHRRTEGRSPPACGPGGRRKARSTFRGWAPCALSGRRGPRRPRVAGSAPRWRSASRATQPVAPHAARQTQACPPVCPSPPWVSGAERPNRGRWLPPGALTGDSPSVRPPARLPGTPPSTRPHLSTSTRRRRPCPPRSLWPWWPPALAREPVRPPPQPLVPDAARVLHVRKPRLGGGQ